MAWTRFRFFALLLWSAAAKFCFVLSQEEPTTYWAAVRQDILHIVFILLVEWLCSLIEWMMFSTRTASIRGRPQVSQVKDVLMFEQDRIPPRAMCVPFVSCAVFYSVPVFGSVDDLWWRTLAHVTWHLVMNPIPPNPTHHLIIHKDRGLQSDVILEIRRRGSNEVTRQVWGTVFDLSLKVRNSDESTRYLILSVGSHRERYYLADSNVNQEHQWWQEYLLSLSMRD